MQTPIVARLKSLAFLVTRHATGDGTFVADGTRFDRRKMMGAKLPAGA